MPNALAQEASLYLRQHADNPVAWLPWNETALQRAREQDRPILLSIGYASCHWCHVMAHESFEDEATAAVMNALYVCIKVDREERPDIDRIYQLAHQALTQRGGGWPLTVFLDPVDLTPFLAGTYFPRGARHGLPAFVDVLRGAENWWRAHREEARAQSAALTDFLRGLDNAVGRRGVPSPNLPVEAMRRLASAFDSEHGGYFGAPKFPQHGALELTLRCDPDSPMLLRSLEAMADGGLRDHLGEGFFRYCVDAQWQIPHFEKMLYDNAQLLPVYAEAAQRLSRADFAAVARGVFAFLEGDMRLASGAYASALDADTEGDEGLTYVWNREEIETRLTHADARLFAARYGLDRPANFEGRSWHLSLCRGIEEAARTAGVPAEEAANRLDAARHVLLGARRQRPQPVRDEKMLCGWNALAAIGLARAGRALHDEGMVDAARRVLDAIRQRCFEGDLLHVTDARTQPAFLDDHACLLLALLEMLATRFSVADLTLAIRIADDLLARFEDEGGGFFLSAHDQERLFLRPKPFLDESVPSGNGVVAQALLRLGHLLGEPRYLDAAERTLAAAAEPMERQPHACCALLLALDEHHHPRAQTLVAADVPAGGEWGQALRRAARLGPLYRLPAADRLPGLLADVPKSAAILCLGTRCSSPLRSPDALIEALASDPPERRHP